MDGSGANARFMFISSIVVDQKNNIYVLDTGAIRKISPTGEVKTIESLGPRSLDSKGPKNSTRNCTASSLTIDRSDNLYVGSYGAIRKIDTSGKVDALVDFNVDCNIKNSDAGIVDLPRAMKVDSEGNVYGFGNHGIFKVSPKGETSVILERAILH